MFSFFQSTAPEEESNKDDISQQVQSPPETNKEEAPANNDESTAPAPEQSIMTTWKDAHDEYCRKHHALRASIQQVLTDSCDEDQEVPWELPSRHTVVTDEDELLSRLLVLPSNTTTKPSTTSTSTSGVFQLTKRLANGIRSTISTLYQDEHELSDWQQSDDDALGSGAQKLSLDLQVPIIHVEHTTRCLQVLQQAITEQTITAPLIMTRSEWKTWCSGQQSEEDNDSSLLSQLSAQDTEWVLTLLVASRHAKILERRRDQNNVDLIVLSSSNSHNSHEENDTDVHLALWDLRHAQQVLETQLEEWSARATECQQKALDYKRQQKLPLALSQMAKRKLLNQRIETSTQSLINLEQTQAAIEMAHSNKALVELLSQSTRILKELASTTPPVEQIQEVQEDLQSELDQLMEMQEAMTGPLTSSSTDYDYDDDELLKELQGLTLQEPVVVATNNTNGTDNGLQTDDATKPAYTPSLSTANNDADPEPESKLAMAS